MVCPAEFRRFCWVKIAREEKVCPLIAQNLTTKCKSIYCPPVDLVNIRMISETQEKTTSAQTDEQAKMVLYPLRRYPGGQCNEHDLTQFLVCLDPKWQCLIIRNYSTISAVQLKPLFVLTFFKGWQRYLHVLPERMCHILSPLHLLLLSEFNAMHGSSVEVNTNRKRPEKDCPIRWLRG